ncbi:DUF4143 domain-containing protein [uncultured Corynebacterium sp.]|uniref:ATP-binding protein n=1 Tax=uncultured Corynebacterium sp. TaxID=159447 RepID=UPI00260103F7|nr:DUF4143 domain-containing protein [uncultured Corynebacterium sp.]
MPNTYSRRVLDDALDAYLPYLPAIAIEGPKGVGKTETASQRVRTTWRLDDPATAALALATFKDGSAIEGPVLLDEWQFQPQLWNIVRRAVDNGAAPGTFLLTGSAAPEQAEAIHSGAGRIDKLRMRPFTLAERGIGKPLLSLRSLLHGEEPTLTPGTLDVSITDYAREICASGLPTISGLPPAIRTQRLNSYLERIVSKEFADQGLKVRQPTLVMAWLRAYAAATATTASYSEILDAATPGEGSKPSKSSSQTYRDLLEQLMILEPLPAWLPVGQTLATMAKSPKHHLCDPGLAARLLNYSETRLLDGSPQSSQEFAQLFESLVVLTARVAAEVDGASVYHLRTRRGNHEIDVIIEGTDGTIVALEAKLSGDVREDDVAHLNWLEANHTRPVRKVLVHCGEQHYRREDGTYVVPLAGLY